MESLKPQIKQLILEFSLVPYYEDEQVRLKERLVELESTKYSVGKSSVRMTAEQEKSPLPLPVFHGTGKDQAFERFWRLEKVRIRYNEVGNALRRARKNLSYLPDSEAELIERVYIDGECKTRVAEELGITRQSFDRRLNRLLKTIVLSNDSYAILG